MSAYRRLLIRAVSVGRNFDDVIAPTDQVNPERTVKEPDPSPPTLAPTDIRNSVEQFSQERDWHVIPAQFWKWLP
ncbi:hypothetical protein [Streptomyces sp. NPDC001816]|uniref:hypothetical protein n=1 Tax=Streptomyces sp. NPDC001816 TaxID=3364612 RepID=UPI00367A0682